ncbi:hypothetical protein FGO68_gene5702 [Halteria grandinella]|uniref:Protein kinase domain-containing protein n=1 Tax=Halteria grandinella TaxID=5974 RepID=A0A8J8P1T0_HALGN|nr:hypothetical protein FGO68_gene5702 [Halteria grandinella]
MLKTLSHPNVVKYYQTDLCQDGRSVDIWSLGCCVIEMLTSKPPWSEFGKDAKTIMRTIIQQERAPKYPDNISAECIQFLNFCFQQDQTMRPTADELLLLPFVLLKNPRQQMQESMEATKLMLSMQSSSINGSNVFGQGYFPNRQALGPYQQSVNSINSIQIAMNSQINLRGKLYA